MARPFRKKKNTYERNGPRVVAFNGLAMKHISTRHVNTIWGVGQNRYPKWNPKTNETRTGTCSPYSGVISPQTHIGCGSKLSRRGKPQVWVHVSTPGSKMWVPLILSHSAILWIDEILHHVEAMGNHGLLVFTGESKIIPGFLRRWCDFWISQPSTVWLCFSVLDTSIVTWDGSPLFGFGLLHLGLQLQDHLLPARRRAGAKDEKPGGWDPRADGGCFLSFWGGTPRNGFALSFPSRTKAQQEASRKDRANSPQCC